MGYHYVPQEYLREFSVAGDRATIWAFNRKSGVGSVLPIVRVAQSPGYYDDDTERRLNFEVEGPAHSALARFRAGSLPEAEDRLRLAVYVATMMKRVPARRRRSMVLVPVVIDDVISEVRELIDEWRQQPTATDAMIQRRTAEVEAFAAKAAVAPPDAVLSQVRSPWPSEQHVELLLAMTWRIVQADPLNQFITSDNPAYFFEAYGLAREAAEVTFPLAPDLALHMSWQGARGSTQVVQARPSLTKELNRRVVSGAEHFVFTAQPAPWLGRVARKADPFLSHLQW